MSVSWSVGQVNIKSQSELDAGGRETFFLSFFGKWKNNFKIDIDLNVKTALKFKAL